MLNKEWHYFYALLLLELTYTSSNGSVGGLVVESNIPLPQQAR